MKRVLIANRGEVAVRILRACEEVGLETVAVYSEGDAEAPHVDRAGAAVCLGPAASAESYLAVDRILAAARRSGADAVHPGYGFLAENAAFAAAVEEAGLTFVGPSPQAIAAMGDKTVARRTVAAAGVPVVPAVEEPAAAEMELAEQARAIGYPILVKAAAGGGGKGMRIVRRDADLAAAFSAAAREALAAFGDDRLFLERYVERPRHVEIQILADGHGNAVHLGERECSVQRRHQKLVEETPSPAVDDALRRRMAKAALAAARSVGYRSAGTVEFLLEESGAFYFLEMNTRLQVEHPITELAAGVDIVRAQLRLAAGERLWLRQQDVVPRGHAIECRVCAEDPANQFLPSPGRIALLREPQGPGVRVDSGIRQGYDIPLYYDSLLSKVSVWAETRAAARERMVAALRAYTILGCTTNIAFLLDVLAHPAFARGETHTHFIDEHFAAWRPREEHLDFALIAAAIDARRRSEVRDDGPIADPTPWSTLGRWRLGEY
jgi:acetyl-CoA carboxylase biotin carboxylase subunit